MRIVFDARWIEPRLSGIGQVARELLRRLPEAAPSDEFVFLFREPALRDRLAADTGFDRRPNARAELVPWGPFAPAGQVALPRRLRAWGADVFHSPNYMLPLPGFPPGRPHRPRAVATIHDLIPLRHPEYTPRALKTRLYPVYRGLMRSVARRADLILTVSEAARADIVDALRIPPARVRVAPNAVGPEFVPPARRAPSRTILYVGRFDPYKNVPGLVRAFERVRARVPDARLRIVGPPDPRYPEARDLAARLNLNDAIEWSGYQDAGALVAAYQQAAVFALLSRAEGFGLPVLEAMACGTPVVCGNGPALTEVAGGAALLAEPDDPEAAAGALARVLTEPALAADLAARGRRRAAEFTWRRTAEEVVAAYRALAAPDGPR